MCADTRTGTAIQSMRICANLRVMHLSMIIIANKVIVFANFSVRRVVVSLFVAAGIFHVSAAVVALRLILLCKDTQGPGSSQSSSHPNE